MRGPNPLPNLAAGWHRARVTDARIKSLLVGSVHAEAALWVGHMRRRAVGPGRHALHPTRHGSRRVRSLLRLRLESLHISQVCTVKVQAPVPRGGRLLGRDARYCGQRGGIGGMLLPALSLAGAGESLALALRAGKMGRVSSCRVRAGPARGHEPWRQLQRMPCASTGPYRRPRGRRRDLAADRSGDRGCHRSRCRESGREESWRGFGPWRAWSGIHVAKLGPNAPRGATSRASPGTVRYFGRTGEPWRVRRFDMGSLPGARVVTTLVLR